MKICTITCQNAYNHGARLQCYALAYWLKKQGHIVEVIDYRPRYMQSPPLLYWPGFSLKRWAKVFLYLPARVRDRIHGFFFNRFSKKHIPLTKKIYRSIDDLRKDPPIADMYIAGSDQIWNTSLPNGTDPAFFLDFGPKSIRRESFAASFAVTSIEDSKKEIVKSLLRNFDKITIREQSALPLLSELGFHGYFQEDPVFLLSSSEWDSIADGTGKGEKYVLVYDFYLGEDIKREAIRISRENKLKIYSICNKRLDYADRNFSISGPATFVSLIKYASFVISNSFHGTVFAIIYNVPFLVLDRPDGLNIRMHDLLERRNQAFMNKLC